MGRVTHKGDRTFARNFTRLMHKNGLTQAEVARRLGFSYTAPYHWCARRSEPSIGTMREIKKLYGCSWDDLLE